VQIQSNARDMVEAVKFVKESTIRASPATVFAFHELPDAIINLTPPGESLAVVQTADISKIGSHAIIQTRILGLFPVRWVAEHTAYDPPRMFEDVQVSGPFSSWRHRHIIEPHATGSILRDEIEYEPLMGFIGRIAAPFAIEPKLRAMFDYRHEVTREWCERQ
jgi:ligand-binding SRPBCC domain-containing protein